MSILNELYESIESEQLWKSTLQLDRNAILKTAGSIDTHLYFIQSGSIKISIYTENEEHLIRFGYAGNFITALDSFIQETPSPFEMQALKKTEVKVLRKADYLALIDRDEKLRKIWDVLQQQLILQQLDREIDLLTSSPKARYERVLKRSPQLFQEIPHRYIAAYLRMTPETLSRLKKS